MSMAIQIAALGRMTPAQLREKYLEAFGEPSRSGNKDFLRKRVAWRIQSLAEGGLSDRAKQRAAELARDADIRLRIPPPPKVAPGAEERTVRTRVTGGERVPMPGSTITRDYRGRRIEVNVLAKGFEYEGEVYRSLSAVAKAVTGAHWNGYLFFGLNHESKS